MKPDQRHDEEPEHKDGQRRKARASKASERLSQNDEARNDLDDVPNRRTADDAHEHQRNDDCDERPRKNRLSASHVDDSVPSLRSDSSPV